MGYLLKTTLPSGRVTSLNAGHHGGTAWVCNPDCGISELRDSSDGGPVGSIEIDEKTRPSGHDGWYFVGPITASGLPISISDLAVQRRDGSCPSDVDFSWGVDIHFALAPC